MLSTASRSENQLTVSLRQASQRVRRSRPPRRALGPPGVGRYPPDRHEVRLAAASRSLHAPGVARVRGAPHQYAQGRPRLGAQGNGGRPVGVSLRRRRPQILPPLVLLGDALPAAADDREGPDAQDPSPERAHVPAPPHHQRHRRGAQTRRSSGSAIPPAASATARTSRPRSTSTAGSSTSTHTEAGRSQK